jgi:hypothetical protein
MKIHELYHETTNKNLYFVNHPKYFLTKSKLHDYFFKKTGEQFYWLLDSFDDYYFEQFGEEALYNKLKKSPVKYKRETDNYINQLSWGKFCDISEIRIKTINVVE